jgi:two-component system cell cycle sensor histidine kinase/response regulator CckA
MKREESLSKKARWAVVLGATILHPFLLYLMIPVFGERSNIVSVIAPIAATLLFSFRIGMVIMPINVVVSAAMFMHLTAMGAEGRPKAVVSGLVIAAVCFGAEKLRLYVAQRKAIEEELNQAKKMEAVGRLAGGVAHDINNTLNAITASVFAHRQELAKFGRHFQDLDNIAAACDRGAQLTRNLLGFARKSNFKRQIMCVNEVVDTVYALLRRTASKNIQIDIRTDQDRPLIVGDRGQIESALMNLCINALDAMGESGTLSIATGTEMGRVFLRVSDTGVGMDEGVKERVFEPFFTTKAEGKGTGLGLSMVYGVVHAMSGRITLDTAPGKGTTVTLTFPKSAARAPNALVSVLPLPSVSPSACVTGRTVLLIDDEPLVLRSGVRMLQTMGCTVLSAGSGRQGISIFKAQSDKVDLVIVDLIMPEMDGVAVIEQLDEIRPSIPVILVSGYTRESDRLELVKDRYKTVRFLTKPYHPDGLVSAAEELLCPGTESVDAGTLETAVSLNAIDRELEFEKEYSLVVAEEDVDNGAS